MTTTPRIAHGTHAVDDPRGSEESVAGRLGPVGGGGVCDTTGGTGWSDPDPASASDGSSAVVVVPVTASSEPVCASTSEPRFLLAIPRPVCVERS